MSTLAELNTYSATSVVATATATATFSKGRKNTVPVSTWDVAKELGTLGSTGTLTVNHVFLTGYTSYTYRDIVLNTAVTPDNTVTLTAVSGTEYTITGISTQSDYLYGSVLMDMSEDCTISASNPDITLRTTITSSASSRTFVINTTITVVDNPQLLPPQGDLPNIVFTADATVAIGTLTPKIFDSVRSQQIPEQYGIRKQFDLDGGGDSSIATAASYFGTKGLSILGTGSIGAVYTTPISLASDFTIEVWWKRITSGSTPYTGPAYHYLGLTTDLATDTNIAANTVTVFVGPTPPNIAYGSTRITANKFGIASSNGTGTAPADSVGVNVFQADTWQHYAIWRKDGLIRHSLNGQIMTVDGLGNTTKADTQTYTIPGISLGQDGNGLDVYFDDYRLSNVARYGTTNFTPTPDTFSKDASTQCLLNFESNNAGLTATFDASDFQGNIVDPHIKENNLYTLDIVTEDSPQTILLTTTSTEPLNQFSVPWNYYDTFGSLKYIGTREAINSYLASMSITYNKTYTPATTEIDFYDPYGDLTPAYRITCANNTITIPSNASAGPGHILFDFTGTAPNRLYYDTVETMEFVANQTGTVYHGNSFWSGSSEPGLDLKIFNSTNTFLYGTDATPGYGVQVTGTINSGFNHYAVTKRPILGTVYLISDLPSSGNTTGDAYIVSSAGTEVYVWNGSAWYSTLQKSPQYKLWVNGVEQKPAYDYDNSVSIPDGYIYGTLFNRFAIAIDASSTSQMQKLRVSSSVRYTENFDSTVYQNNFVPLDSDTICLFRFDSFTASTYPPTPSPSLGHADAAVFPALSSSPREITYTLTNPIGCVTTVTQPYVEDTE
tara:strand:- start:1512 stop:4025 length:2514 start_codon:yes stop_codon:yes gene_type:complete